MCLYLNALSCESSEDLYLFPPVVKDCKTNVWKPRLGKPLSYSAAYGSFKKLLLKCNIDAKLFGTHSLRSGGTTDLFQQLPERFIDKLGRWRSKEMKFRYAKDNKDVIVKQLKNMKFS